MTSIATRLTPSNHLWPAWYLWRHRTTKCIPFNPSFLIPTQIVPHFVAEFLGTPQTMTWYSTALSFVFYALYHICFNKHKPTADNYHCSSRHTTQFIKKTIWPSRGIDTQRFIWKPHDTPRILVVSSELWLYYNPTSFTSNTPPQAKQTSALECARCGIWLGLEGYDVMVFNHIVKHAAHFPVVANRCNREQFIFKQYI